MSSLAAVAALERAFAAEAAPETPKTPVLTGAGKLDFSASSWGSAC